VTTGNTQRMRTALIAVAAVLALSAPARAADSFVVRSGAKLTVNGKPFRFGGANVEWLGLAGYGPLDPAGPHYASHYEIDDALATARELGATVVRSQTMGDSVGCELCIEPARGRFNAAAFEEIDYALASARRHGIRVVPTIVGDDAVRGGSGCVYLGWRGYDTTGCSLVNMAPFWTDPVVLGDVEEHIRAVLEHVNVYTHVAYKDDPTILGWDLLNGGGSPLPWTREIVRYLRTIDTRHLVLTAASNARLDENLACVAFVYPHWSQPYDTVVAPQVAACKAAAKPFIAYEYGWDQTNYATAADLRRFLERLRGDPEIAGDAFWALQGHADGHGWMPIPADTSDPLTARSGESGHWWALYYTGLRTLVNTAADMAARAQIIRRHAYAMRGLKVPKHAIPPAPAITSTAGGRIYWRGSAGAARYSIQQATGAAGPWTTPCRRCAGDGDDGWVAPSAGWFRVIPYNLDGRAGPASAPVRSPS
jgi:mannan endo-1,4-beta-mannosidase